MIDDPFSDEPTGPGSTALAIAPASRAEDSAGQAPTADALAQLAGTVAHDFNNLLQVTVGYVSIILASLDKPEVDRARIRRGAEAIQAATERAATLTQRLLDAAESHRGARRPADPDEHTPDADTSIERDR